MIDTIINIIKDKYNKYTTNSSININKNNINNRLNIELDKMMTFNTTYYIMFINKDMKEYIRIPYTMRYYQ